MPDKARVRSAPSCPGEESKKLSSGNERNTSAKKQPKVFRSHADKNKKIAPSPQVANSSNRKPKKFDVGKSLKQVTR